jgi:AcrR family transcriptional regulator
MVDKKRPGDSKIRPDPNFTGPDSGFHVFNIFGHQYQLPLLDPGSETRERILMSSTVLFAKRGYAAVSVRDIAQANGIKPSSIYNHFKSKEALWAARVEHLKILCGLYFELLEQAVGQAYTFEEVLAVSLHEPKRFGYHIFIAYGFSLVMLEQVNDPLAAEAFHYMFKGGLDFLKGKFDDCVARGLVRPFDTRVVAHVIMSTIFVGLTAKVQDFEGRPAVFLIDEVLADLERFILWATAAKPGNP